MLAYKLSIVLLILNLVGSQKTDWNCLNPDSLIEFQANDLLTSGTYKKIDVYYQFVDCRKCTLIYLNSLDSSSNTFKNYSEIDGRFDYYFEVRSGDQDNQIICSRFVYNNFGECGQFRFDILDKNNCKITITVESNDINLHIGLGISLIVILIIFSNLIEKYYTKLKLKLKNWIKSKLNSKIGTNKPEQIIELTVQKDNLIESKETEVQVKRKRYGSLDAFRGLSIMLMMFVIYTYQIFTTSLHIGWNGFNLASAVFPWFLFIMGINIPLSIHIEMNKPGTKRLRIFFKIFVRTIKLFLIGLYLNTSYDFDIEYLRIFGVLQRISLCYFILATVELILYTKPDVDKYKNSKLYYFSDQIYSWAHTLIVLILLIVWLLITYLLPVPGCPIGYLGAGGVEDNSQYYNCTGGAAAYIDDLILGKKHQYRYGSHIKIYKSGDYSMANRFEPEGFLGTLTSCFCTYFGVIAGRVIMFYKKEIQHMIFWFVWLLITLSLYAIFTGFDYDDGIIPVNKNLWTPTYTFISVTTGFALLIILYFIIDYKCWWNGNPLIYIGKNSILFYILFNMFITTFPARWEVPNLHGSLFYLSIWSISFWTAISAYLYKKNVFFNV